MIRRATIEFIEHFQKRTTLEVEADDEDPAGFVSAAFKIGKEQLSAGRGKAGELEPTDTSWSVTEEPF